MFTLGIDIAKYRHNASLLNEKGELLFGNFAFNNDQKGLDKLLGRLKSLGLSPSQILVGMEATGHYWMLLYQHLKESKFEVLIINPLVTRARRNIAVRGSKTDALDSLLIAKILRETDLKTSAHPDAETKELRDLTRLRFECQQEATALKIRLISLLDLVFPEYHALFRDIAGSASRELLRRFPSAEDLAKVDIRRLTSILRKASRGRLGRTKAEAVKQAAINSFARQFSQRALVLQIKYLLEQLDLLLTQIAELDREIKQYFQEIQRLLKTIPGLGQVWSPTVLAEVMPVFHPENPNGGDAFVALAGLDPRVDQTGQQPAKARMSKRGSKYLRTAVMEAANVAVFIAKDPMFCQVYERQRNKNKNHLVALSHVANKMLHVIFSVMKNQKTYTPRPIEIII